MASRVCQTQLSTAGARRETYVGPWIPEPLPQSAEWVSGRPGGAASDPADRVTLDESVSMAFLVVLDAMTPAERVHGAQQVARFLARQAGAAPGVQILECTVNGQPGLAAQVGGVTVSVLAFDITDD